MKQTKRILALFLAVLCFCMIPLSAFAETLDKVPAIVTAEQEVEETTALVPPQENESVPEPETESTGPVTDETPPVTPTEDKAEPSAKATQPERDYVPGFEVEQPGGKYAWPVPSSITVSQGYGSGKHEALDIAAAEGETVLAAEAGTVTAVQEWDGVSVEGNQSYGNMVTISHKDGNTTLYAHLSETLVSEGEVVERGQHIGSIGQTGNVTGPHLHFEVRNASGRIDPTGYIAGSGTEECEPQDGGSIVRLPRSTSRMTRAAGQNGVLRVLYYVFKSEVGYLSSIHETITRFPAKAILANGTYQAAYCLNKDLLAADGTDYTWSSLSWAQKRLVGDILALGFHWESNTYWPAESAENYQWAVCQLLVWAVQEKTIFRSGSGDLVIPASFDADIEKAASHSYDPNGMKSYYYKLKSDLVNLRKIPSFAGRTPSETKPIKLSWNGTEYSAVVTDTNGVLSRFDFFIEGAEVKRNGNTLSIRADANMAAEGEKLSVLASYSYVCGEGAVAVWRSNGGQGGDGNQDIAVYDGNGTSDPVPAYIKISFDAVGSAGLLKRSEDGDVAGKSFLFSGSDGSSVIKTTDSSGAVSLDGLPIYVAAEDENSEKETEGERITYTATEVNVPVKYVVPTSQSFQLFEGQEVTLEFENRLKKWRILVTKADRETDTVAQGDATLAGAVYGIYHNGILQDSYTTDSSGRFTSKYYVCGTGWTLGEITPSEGYLLNTGTEQIGLRPEETSIEYNATSKGVKEQVIKGRVGITKHTDDGSTQIETPETGAEFQVYLSASGSYEAAKATERDIIVIGENGYGETKLLPYGMYTVHQTKGWEGKEKTPDFQVFISEDGHTYPFIINNRVFEALIQIVKKDSETGRVIPASGIGFKIKDLTSGKWVSQHINYPTPMDLSIFYTDVTGRLMLPSPLTYGQYELYEQQSAYGYVLSKDPVPFTVDGTAKEITVEMGNAPQKGKITIEKHGEVFASVRSSQGKYQPVYEEQDLPGAVYALYADEDIKTPDGTLRYPVGALIEQVETDENGSASFFAVYLGKYTVKEVTAPYGYVLDPTLYHVEFTYAGQEITLQTQTLDCHDERQKVEVSLKKSLEQDETYGIGMNGEYKAVRFGLFAAENLRAVDGKVIPKDGLIEEISLREDLTASFSSDLTFGSYYVKETSTDDRYILSEKVYPVNFEYTGQKETVVKIGVNDGDSVENHLKRGRLEGLKTDTAKNPLPGALFGLFSPDTKQFIEQTALATAVSDKDGKFSFENIPFGRWLVKELRAPSGYSLSAETFEAEVTEDGAELSCTFENRKIPAPKPKYGSITGKKIGEDKQPLENVVFGLFLPETTDFSMKNAIATAETDDDGVFLFKDIAYGKYLVKELVSLPGYVLLKDPLAVEITEEGNVIELREIVNEHTKVQISKQDMTTGKELPGAKLELLDSSGKVLETWVSGTDPHLIERLPAGEYVLHEETAPNGYLTAEDVKFTVLETGEIQKVAMKDVPKPIAPNTGEDRTIVYVSGAFVLALIGAFVCSVLLHRERRKKNR